MGTKILAEARSRAHSQQILCARLQRTLTACDPEKVPLELRNFADEGFNPSTVRVRDNKLPCGEVSHSLDRRANREKRERTEILLSYCRTQTRCVSQISKCPPQLPRTAQMKPDPCFPCFRKSEQRSCQPTGATVFSRLRT